MKEKIAESLVTILDYIKTGVEKGAELTAEQLPLIAKEIISYAIIGNLFETAFLFLLSILVWYLAQIISVWFYCGEIVCLAMIYSDLENVLKARFAPRVYLLEYAREFLKNKEIK